MEESEEREQKVRPLDSTAAKESPRRPVVGMLVLLVAAVAFWALGSLPTIDPVTTPPTLIVPSTASAQPPSSSTSSVPSSSDAPVPTTLANRPPERLPAITLTPAPDVDPVRVSTVIGDLVFTSLQFPAGHGFYEMAATPYGPVAIEDSALRWSTDYQTWEGVPVPYDPGRIVVVGNDVVVGAIRYAWNGTGWTEQAKLDLPGLVDQIVFGPRGAVMVSDHTTMYYSTDGVHFTEAERGPTKDLLLAEESPPTSEPGDDGMAGECPESGSGPDSVISAVLATDAGFVALTSAWHPDYPICEPLPWFSADGNTWELVSHDSPFGKTAFLRNSNLYEIAERDGRFVAAGGVGDPGAEQGAVWVSDDGLAWQRADVDLDYAFAVAAGEMGWMLTGVVDTGNTLTQHMWFSTDGLTWDGPYELPRGLGTGYLPPQLAVGSDAIFGVGFLEDFIPVVARLQDRGG